MKYHKRYNQVSLSVNYRKVDFPIDSSIPKYWLNNDCFLTRFLDALAMHFPDGEKFFIYSVRAYSAGITDEKLKHEVSNFVKQEAMHGMEHTKYNEILRSQGIKVDQILDSFVEIIKFTKKHLPKKWLLATTVAAEHFTATLAEGLIGDEQGLLDNADETMRAMFTWHAVEEVEHKTVAFDVYDQAAGGGYFTRVIALIFLTVMLNVFVLRFVNHMLKVDGVTQRYRILLKGIWSLYKPNGVFSGLGKPYLAWFKPGFHPSQTGVPVRIAQWIELYDAGNDPMTNAEKIINSA